MRFAACFAPCAIMTAGWILATASPAQADELAVTPSTGGPGTALTVNAACLNPSQIATLSAPALGFHGRITASFSRTFTVPAGTAPGTHQITLTCESDGGKTTPPSVTTVQFTVPTPTPSLPTPNPPRNAPPPPVLVPGQANPSAPIPSGGAHTGGGGSQYQQNVKIFVVGALGLGAAWLIRRARIRR